MNNVHYIIAWRAMPEELFLQRVERFVNKHNQRAKGNGAEATLTAQEWIEIMQAHNFTCAHCGENQADSIDHVKPVSQGGGTTKENCVPSCVSCNTMRGDVAKGVDVMLKLKEIGQLHIVADLLTKGVAIL